eukprot:TRINITY_DN8770_c0_g1_i2.p1 TRINITY_DN8770_c0_g1~~TRINITY_DN8770_c0_g1_i2.p1  ORF type:complete len:210 (+),score=53.57 TRINITY_DN8770_c0_g1_i2:108-737(+)
MTDEPPPAEPLVWRSEPAKLVVRGSRPSTAAALSSRSSSFDFLNRTVTVIGPPPESPVRSSADQPTGPVVYRRPQASPARRRPKEPEQPPEPTGPAELAEPKRERDWWRQNSTSSFVYLPPVSAASAYLNNYVRLSMRFVAWLAWTAGDPARAEPLAWTETVPVTETVESVAHRIIEHHHGAMHGVHLWKDQIRTRQRTNVRQPSPRRR